MPDSTIISIKAEANDLSSSPVGFFFFATEIRLLMFLMLFIPLTLSNNCFCQNTVNGASLSLKTPGDKSAPFTREGLTT